MASTRLASTTSRGARTLAYEGLQVATLQEATDRLEAAGVVLAPGFEDFAELCSIRQVCGMGGMAGGVGMNRNLSHHSSAPPYLSHHITPCPNPSFHSIPTPSLHSIPPPSLHALYHSPLHPLPLNPQSLTPPPSPPTPHPPGVRTSAALGVESGGWMVVAGLLSTAGALIVPWLTGQHPPLRTANERKVEEGTAWAAASIVCATVRAASGRLDSGGGFLRGVSPGKKRRHHSRGHRGDASMLQPPQSKAMVAQQELGKAGQLCEVGVVLHFERREGEVKFEDEHTHRAKDRDWTAAPPGALLRRGCIRSRLLRSRLLLLCNLVEGIPLAALTVYLEHGEMSRRVAEPRADLR